VVYVFVHAIRFRVNGVQIAPLRSVTPSIPALLEDYFRSADRRRIAFARIELKF